MANPNKTGRNETEHGTFIQRRLMMEPAWIALSPKAQILYVWLRLEWKGAKYNNNGKIQFSYRQAMARIGIGINAVMGAFHELQAKGFVVVTQLGALGIEGEARGPSYELTDIGLPFTEERGGRHLYRNWSPGKDFEVARHNVNNPLGRNGKAKTLSSNVGRTYHQNSDVSENPITKRKTPHHHNSDVRANPGTGNVIKMKTSLVTIPGGEFPVPDLRVAADLELCPMLASRRG